jgi:hypothetical protein
MGESGSKNWAETLLALLQEHVPKPLRKSVTLTVAALVVSFTATKAYFGIEVRDVISSSYFLTVVTIVVAILAIEILRHTKRPLSYVVFSVLSVVVVGIGILSWNSWHFYYDDRGVYQERRWRKISQREDRCMLSWRLIAATKNANQVTLRVTTKPNACPRVTIENLHPLASGSDFKGAETGEQSVSGREFSFDGFRRPAQLTFFLTLGNLSPSVDPRSCFSKDLTIIGSPASPENSEEKKE